MQSSELILNLMPTVFILLSLFYGTPVKTLYGDAMCWVLLGILSCLCMKQILGGFFIAAYRIICLKRSDIAMNITSQRKLKIQLLRLELITMVLFLELLYFGTTISGTEPSMEFLRLVSLFDFFHNKFSLHWNHDNLCKHYLTISSFHNFIISWLHIILIGDILCWWITYFKKHLEHQNGISLLVPTLWQQQLSTFNLLSSWKGLLTSFFSKNFMTTIRQQKIET